MKPSPTSKIIDATASTGNATRGAAKFNVIARAGVPSTSDAEKGKEAK